MLYLILTLFLWRWKETRQQTHLTLHRDTPVLFLLDKKVAKAYKNTWAKVIAKRKNNEYLVWTHSYGLYTTELLVVTPKAERRSETLHNSLNSGFHSVPLQCRNHLITKAPTLLVWKNTQLTNPLPFLISQTFKLMLYGVSVTTTETPKNTRETPQRTITQ